MPWQINGGANMVSYNPLWKTLIDMGLKKLDICDLTGISTSTLAKMSRNKYVALEVLERICLSLNCPIEAVVVFKQKNSNVKTVLFRCSYCNFERLIPKYVVDYLDSIDRDGDLTSMPFDCKDCNSGRMQLVCYINYDGTVCEI